MTGGFASDGGWERNAVPIWLAMLVLAPIVGSFLGVMLRRQERDGQWVWGRSVCEGCRQAIAPYDLVPIVSFVALGGRCRQCGAPICLFHPGIELASVAVAAWAISAGDGAWLVASCLFGWLLLALACADFSSGQLPDVLTLPLLVLGLGYTALCMPDATTDHALACAAGYLLFRAVAALYERLRGHAGLGQGDAKLMAALGAWIGLAGLPDLLLIAAGTALVAALALRLAGYRIDARTRLPFGPFLAFAAWTLWLYAPQNVLKLSPYLSSILK
jgi:leader peptidase (prepilin peptidase)/N-methyltransferase